jgi:hypothetical protein
MFWDLLILFLLSGAIGYILVGGITFGFPKYHAPFLPVISLLVAAYTVYKTGQTSARELVIFGLLIAGSVAWFIYMVGDPILTLNFAFRDTMIHSPINVPNILAEFLRQIGMSCLLAVAAIAVMYLVSRRSGLYRNCVVGLTAALLSLWLAMNIIQAKADYLTRYCYGDRETRQMISFLKSKMAPNDLVLATRDIVYYTNNGTPYWADSVWNSSVKFAETIKRPDVQCVVYGVGHHSISQYRNTFLNPAVIAILKGDYSKSQIGTYTVWTKNKEILSKSKS